MQIIPSSIPLWGKKWSIGQKNEIDQILPQQA